MLFLGLLRSGPFAWTARRKITRPFPGSNCSSPLFSLVLSPTSSLTRSWFNVDQDRCGPNDITPAGPVWMAGYGDRDRRSEGVYSPWAPGRSISGGADDEALLIAADLIGFDLAYAAQAKQRIAAATGMLPRQVVLATTHTHCGPLFYPMMMPGEPELEYAGQLCERLVAVAVAARGGALPGGSPFRGGAPGSGSTAGCRAAGKRCSLPIRTARRPRPRHPLVREPSRQAAGNPDRVRLSRHSLGAISSAGITLGFSAWELREKTGAPAFFSAGCAGDVRPWYNPGGAGFRRPEIDEVAAAGSGLARKCWPAGLPRFLSRRMGSRSQVTSTCSPTRVSRRRPPRPLRRPGSGTAPPLGAIHEGAAFPGSAAGRLSHEVQVLQLNPEFRVLFLGGEVLSEIGLHLKRALSPAVTVAAAYSNGDRVHPLEERLPAGRVRSRRIPPLLPPAGPVHRGRRGPAGEHNPSGRRFDAPGTILR